METREQEPPRTSRKKKALRLLEWTFWVLGFLLVGSYIFIYVDRTAYQAYEEWAFDRKLKHEPAPVIGFLLHSLKFGHAKQAPAPTPPPPKSQDSAEKFARPPLPRTVLRPGSVIGRMEIARLGMRVMVLESTDHKTLRLAAGHIEGTALPGEKGNVGIAGHRDTFFRPLRSIRKDDVIELTTLHGCYRYVVEETQVVTPDDTYVLENNGVDALTLVTCFPFNYVGSAPKRFVVYAREITPQSPQGS